MGVEDSGQRLFSSVRRWDGHPCSQARIGRLNHDVTGIDPGFFREAGLGPIIRPTRHLISNAELQRPELKRNDFGGTVSIAARMGDSP